MIFNSLVPAIMALARAGGCDRQEILSVPGDAQHDDSWSQTAGRGTSFSRRSVWLSNPGAISIRTCFSTLRTRCGSANKSESALLTNCLEIVILSSDLSRGVFADS